MEPREPKPPPISDAVADWLVYIEQFSEHTKKLYKRCVVDFISKADYTTIDDLQPLDIRNYINKLLLSGKKKSSANAHVNALRSFGRFLSETYGIENPCRDIKKFKVRSYHQPFITYKQYRRILASATKRQSDVIQLLAHTGLRADEMASLKYENIIDDFSSIRFVGKGGKQRTVPLNDIARDILRRHCNGEKIINFSKRPKNIYYMCRRAGTRAGEIHLTAHMLRRFFGSECIHAGLSLLIVSKLLGHSSVQTTERYLKCDSSYLNGATDVLTLTLLQENAKRKNGGA